VKRKERRGGQRKKMIKDKGKRKKEKGKKERKKEMKAIRRPWD